jgi:HAD superfamily hydrolase (TIGR01509 family)
MSATRALLFDLDGTMVNTDALHIRAYNTLLQPYGRSVDIDYYRRKIMGFGAAEIMGGLFPDNDPAENAVLSDEKERLFRSYLTDIDPVAGLEKLLNWADEAGWEKAVVTNAPRDNAEQLLKGAGLHERFDILVVASELEHEKPHPLPYRLAAERVDADPRSSVAFEDSLAGVASASSAGAHTFGMLTALPEADLRDAGAAAVLNDFTESHLWEYLSEDIRP